MKYTAIVLAAGKGSRMNSSISKQYIELGGFPLIYYSLQAFEHSRVDDVVLVAGQDETDFCRSHIVEKYGFHKVRQIVAGGSERYLSVYQGLCAADNPDVVLIHDGARPFVTQEIIERTIEAAVKHGSGIAAVRAKDTVKIADDEQYSVQTPARDHVWMMQTPQTFLYSDIRSAYEKVIAGNAQQVTDDAMVMEVAFGRSVKLVEGNYRNIKVTTPEDLEIADLFVRKLKLGIDM